MAKKKKLPRKRIRKVPTKITVGTQARSLLKNMGKLETKLERLRAKIEAGERLPSTEIAALNAAFAVSNVIGASW